MDKVCFWSVGDGDYAFIVQALVDSFHSVGMEGDFYVFSDREIRGATTHQVKDFDKSGCFFKLTFLRELIKFCDHTHFIYLDADTLFLRKPFNLLILLQGDPLHLFFEGDCTLTGAKRTSWWDCPLPEYVRLMRDCGVTNKHVYHVNGGFFIVTREAVNLVCNLAIDFAEYAVSKRYLLPDEPALSYAMHMLAKDAEAHLLSRYREVWASDWEGVFKNKLPSNKPWIFNEYFSLDAHTVNPAIVHAIKSKELLIKLGQQSQF